MSEQIQPGGAHDVPRPMPPNGPRPAPSGSNGSASPEDWPDFEPLRAQLPPVEPFDPELLPNALRSWILDIAERMQCPLDFVGAALLVALAAVVGRRVGIRPKRRDDWTVIANLWGGVVGRPGVLKTPAVTEVFRPIKRLEIEEQKKFEEENRRKLAEQFVEDAKDKDAQRKIKEAIAAGDEEEAQRLAQERTEKPRKRPTRKRYLLNDATVEKVGEILNENPSGVLIFRDELMGFVHAMDKEGHECDRAFYLEAWNGNNRFTYDRIGRGTVDIEAACVSIFGCVQPGPLGAHLQAAIDATSGDDGFIQRFQVMVWPDVHGEWKLVDRFPDKASKQQAYEVFLALEALNRESLDVEAAKFESDDDVPCLRFAPNAQKVFNKWLGDLERRLRSSEELPTIESHLAKYRSLVPSIALLLHLAEGGRGDVTLAALQRALRWASYLESHARRTYSVGTNVDVASAQAIERKLRNGSLKDGFTLRDVTRPQWAGLTRRDTVEQGLTLLGELGWLRSETLRTGGAPKTIYRVNPKLNFGHTAPEGTANTDRSPATDLDEEVI